MRETCFAIFLFAVTKVSLLRKIKGMLTAKIINLLLTLWWVLVSAVYAVDWGQLKTKSILALTAVLKSPAVVTVAGLLVSVAASIVAAHLCINWILFVIPNKLQHIENYRDFIKRKMGYDLRFGEAFISDNAQIFGTWFLHRLCTQSKRLQTIISQSSLVVTVIELLRQYKPHFFFRSSVLTGEQNQMIISRDFMFGYYTKNLDKKGLRIKFTKEAGPLVYYVQFFTCDKTQETFYGNLWCLNFKQLMIATIIIRLVLSLGVSGWGHLWRQIMGCGNGGVGGSAFLEPSDVDTPNHHIQNYWNQTEFGNRLRANLRRNGLGHPSQLFDPRRYLGPKAPTGDLWDIWVGRLIEGCANEFKVVSVRPEYTEKTQFEWFCDRVIKLGCFIFITLSLFFFYSALSEGKYVKAIKKYGDKIEGGGGDHDE